VYTDERGQIIFLDTPGMNQAKNKLGDYMLNAALETIRDADVILWLTEVNGHIGAGEQYIIDRLKETDLPVILVINKTDMVPPEAVLASISLYKDVLDFKDIVPVSAQKGDNIGELLKVINSPELTEFQYIVSGDDWNVSIR
jgi:GTP-binding protein Era